ncbi:hypothetical protein ACFPJ1_25640, partial [Kribbella qitaiheensis]|uniref:hypothetical protein n=1 Tax=Kribbella qitaiheensis TaxID=1544730 RepID=UPI00361051C0
GHTAPKPPPLDTLNTWGVCRSVRRSPTLEIARYAPGFNTAALTKDMPIPRLGADIETPPHQAKSPGCQTLDTAIVPIFGDNRPEPVIDLVDLVLIATTDELEARLTIRAIQGEAALAVVPARRSSTSQAPAGGPAMHARPVNAVPQVID